MNDLHPPAPTVDENGDVIDHRGFNLTLLERVEKRIRNYPETYNQGTWFETKGYWQHEITPGFLEGLDTQDLSVCGTKACVAGHAVWLSGRSAEFMIGNTYFTTDGVEQSQASIDWDSGGQMALGLDRDTARWLFSGARTEAAMGDILACLREGGTILDAQRIEDQVDRETRLDRIRNRAAEVEAAEAHARSLVEGVVSE